MISVVISLYCNCSRKHLELAAMCGILSCIARSPSPPCTLFGGVESTMTSMAQLNALALLVLLLTASLPTASAF